MKHLLVAVLFPFFVISVLISLILFYLKEFSWRFNHWCYICYYWFDGRAEKVWKNYLTELRGYINGNP